MDSPLHVERHPLPDGRAGFADTLDEAALSSAGMTGSAVDTSWRDERCGSPFGSHDAVVFVPVLMGPAGGGEDLPQQQPEPLSVHPVDGVIGADQLGVAFDRILNAQDIGSYKPSARNFDYMTEKLESLGIQPATLLHTAESLFHDHVPAKREGLPSVWINRRHDRPGWGATPEPSQEWSYDLEFASMRAFADAVDRAFAATPGA
jgi:hypothetical protein